VTKEKHIVNYMDHFGYDSSDWIKCEYPGCGQRGVDFHHVQPRSSFGSKRKAEQDHHSNIVILCIDHHQRAHGPECRAIKETLKEVVSKRK
jgi:hypothetical protein